MIYCGVPANQWASSGVAIAIRKDWKHKIQDYTWISDRIIETRIKVLNRNFTIVAVYAPVEGKEQVSGGLKATFFEVEYPIFSLFHGKYFLPLNKC